MEHNERAQVADCKHPNPRDPDSWCTRPRGHAGLHGWAGCFWPQTHGAGMDCQECGMLVEPASAFHPWLYCQLFKVGVRDPAKFLEGQHFIPDPAHWGEDAPAKQRAEGRA